MKVLYYFLIGIIPLVFATCNKSSEPDPNQPKEFNLFIDFWNPDGDNPQINFDGAESSPEIKIDFSKTFTGITEPPNLTKVIIDNVRIIDSENKNYKIDKITAYEWRDGISDWKVDVEFVMNYNQVVDIAVVLTLDASGSLGTDFAIIKDFANDFVSKIYSSTPNANFGIVDFSDEVNGIGLTNDRTEITSYINNIEQGHFTALYDAMYASVDSLQKFEAEGKAVVTFTDGTDNNSDPSNTPDAIYDKLVNDPNHIKVNSFTIGFEGNGGVDRAVLEKLAANGGVAEFPTTMEELEQVFDKFSKSIANVYNLTYLRNQQIIPQTDPARLKFVIEASPK